MTCVLKQYIPTKETAHFIVLSQRIIANIAYTDTCRDFRSNAGTFLHVRPKKFRVDAERLVVETTSCLGLEFSGG